MIRLLTILTLLCSLHAAQAEDKRSAILMPAAEQQLVLQEMRGFLETVQAITAALAEEDFSAVAEAARKAGMAEARKTMPRLRPLLPEGFRRMGHSAHQGFDRLALDTELEDGQHTLKQLGEILATCNACHRTYRLQVK